MSKASQRVTYENKKIDTLTKEGYKKITTSITDLVLFQNFLLTLGELHALTTYSPIPSTVKFDTVCRK